MNLEHIIYVVLYNGAAIANAQHHNQINTISFNSQTYTSFPKKKRQFFEAEIIGARVRKFIFYTIYKKRERKKKLLKKISRKMTKKKI